MSKQFVGNTDPEPLPDQCFLHWYRDESGKVQYGQVPAAREEMLFKADSDQPSVRYGGIRIDLGTFNHWVRRPRLIDRTVDRLRRLQNELVAQRERLAGEQAMIRELSEELEIER